MHYFRQLVGPGVATVHTCVDTALGVKRECYAKCAFRTTQETPVGAPWGTYRECPRSAHGVTAPRSRWIVVGRSINNTLDDVLYSTYRKSLTLLAARRVDAAHCILRVMPQQGYHLGRSSNDCYSL